MPAACSAQEGQGDEAAMGRRGKVRAATACRCLGAVAANRRKIPVCGSAAGGNGTPPGHRACVLQAAVSPDHHLLNKMTAGRGEGGWEAAEASMKQSGAAASTKLHNNRGLTSHRHPHPYSHKCVGPARTLEGELAPAGLPDQAAAAEPRTRSEDGRPVDAGGRPVPPA